MKNLAQISLALNLLLAIAVAVLFYLHFSYASKSISVVAEQAAPVAKEETEEEAAIKNLPVPVIANMSNKANIVFIDYDSLIANYDFYKKIQKDLQVKLQSVEKELTDKQMKLQKDVAEYQEKQSLYTDQMKQQKEQQLMADEQALMELKQKRELQFTDQQKQLNEKLLNNLYGYFKRLAKENKVDYVMSYQRGVPGVLYGNDSLDITKNVLNGLNKEYKKK